MNYLRCTTKGSIGKRALLLCLTVALSFFLLGMGTAAAIMTEREKEPVVIVGQYIEDAPVYGAFKGVTFDPAREWAVDKYTFLPLEDVPLNDDLQEFAYYLSAAYEIDYSLTLALMETESNFKANLISATDDYGLMQINRCNAGYLQECIGASDLLNPYDNIKGGLYILRGLFEKYGDTAKVLMAYNMGEAGAARLWEQGIFEINYSKRVLQSQETFNERFNHIQNGGIHHD